MAFFNNNFYVCGHDLGNLPDDPTYKGPGDPPKVKRYYDAMSLDVHVYMVAQPAYPDSLKSPRIGSIRWWRPNTRPGEESGNNKTKKLNACVPYLFFACGNLYTKWCINIRYNHLFTGTSQVISHSLSGMHAYLVA